MGTFVDQAPTLPPMYRVQVESSGAHPATIRVMIEFVDGRRYSGILDARR